MIHLSLRKRETMAKNKRRQLMISLDDGGWEPAKTCFTNAWEPITQAIEAVEDLDDVLEAYEVLAKG